MKRLLSLILLFGTSGVLTAAYGQSLADLARTERERRKAASNKIYTNEDVGTSQTVKSPDTSPAAATPSAQTPASEKRTGPTDSQGRDEKYWRDAFQTARTDLKRAEDKLHVLEMRRAELNLQMLRQSDIYNRENVISVQLTALDADLAETRKAADTSRQKIAALEEELRRTGGLPGWAR